MTEPLDAKQVAKLLGFRGKWGFQTVIEKTRLGEIHGWTAGREYRYDFQAVEDYRKTHRVRA